MDEQNRRLPPSGPPLGGDRDFVRHHRSWWQRRRAVIIAVVAVVLVCGGVTTAVLATRNLDDVSVADPSALASSAAPAPLPSPTVTVKTSATPVSTAKPPARTTAKGTVLTVVSTGHWTLTVEKGLNLSVAATPSTTYAHNKDAGDVKKGDSMTVVGTMVGGVIDATTISIEKKSN